VRSPQGVVRNGATTYRDGLGRMTGTATRDANGTMTPRRGRPHHGHDHGTAGTMIARRRGTCACRLGMFLS